MIKNTFRCALTTAVFTNRQVISQGKPITIAIHDIDDGSWKFFSREDKMTSNEQAVIISLEEILMIDPSISEIAHLPEGAIATRRFAGDNWKIISNSFQSKQNEMKKAGL
jgi:hypothetical protein